VSVDDRPPGEAAETTEAKEAKEASVAIDLSRRKGPRHPGDARGHATLGHIRELRDSLVEVKSVAAPYVTTLRITRARLARDRRARVGALVLALMALLGIFADLLASDLPIACRWRGTLYALPSLTRPVALAGLDCAAMSRERGPGDWMILPLVARGPAETGDDADVLLAPGTRGHPMGTDSRGRDVFARVAHGTRTALGIGLGASTVLVVVGVSLGALAGFAGGIVDALVARAVEALTAIPTLILVLVVGGLVPHSSSATLLYTIALTRWTELARLVRSEVLLALGSDYVTAARALGASPPRVLLRHVLPNAVGPAITGAAFAVAWVALLEATVDFLRVGSPDRAASWGAVMGDARAHAQAWWLLVFPGAALLATLIASNLVGEAARDALDPRLRGAELPGSTMGGA
jgi:peptide/nickel transport system permease protein